jgi:branched-chain amino acid transport system permease protein
MAYSAYFVYNLLIYVALTVSWNLVSGFTGQFSLGHNAFFGLGAYTAAIAWRAGLVGYFDVRAFLLSAIVCATVAAAVGYLLLGRLRGFYFSLGYKISAFSLSAIPQLFVEVYGGLLHISSTA